LGQRLDEWSVGSAPHHYGGLYGNYVAAHLAPAIEWFTFVEWDEAQTPGLDTSAYRIRDGMVEAPNLPGFGLRLDEDAFAAAVTETGYRVQHENA
jgi:L-alanine-DL-glutamate epimerase-like enolase superfamily enzyme